MNKTTSVNLTYVNIPQAVKTVVRNNGSKTITYRASQPIVSRFVGEESSLTTFTGRDGRFRPCKHTRKRWENVQVSISGPAYRSRAESTLPTARASCSCTNVRIQGYPQAYAQFKAAGVSQTLVVTPNWEALALQSLGEMLPAIGGDNSLINSLLELKDFKRIFGAIGRRGITIIDTIKAGIRDSLYDRPLQRIASAHLEYSFAWAPLKRELTNMFVTLRDFRVRLQSIIDRAELPQQRYYGTSIAGTGSPSALLNGGDLSINFSGDPDASFFASRERYRVMRMATEDYRYHATVRYRYALPPGLKKHQRDATALLDVLGINANPAILWNAIPFSFVIDWFVNVGGLLDGLRVENNPIKSEILEFSHSVKARTVIGLEMSTRQQYNEVSHYWEPYETVDRCTLSFYERRTGVPNLRLALLTSGLDLREAVLSTSMGIGLYSGKGRRK